EGTLRVLRAARSSGVQRVVLTSSFAAVGYGHGHRSKPLTEADWSNSSARLSPYVKSKLFAEQAAWDFSTKSGLELSVINPVFILGPALSRDYSSSVLLIKNMIDGNLKKVPRISFGIVDVRDVADLQIRAMTNPAAAGQRFIAAAGASMTMKEIGETVVQSLPDPRSMQQPDELPNWMVRIASIWKPEVRQFTGELGLPRHCSNEKARTLLEWRPRSNEEAIQSCVRSLLALEQQ
ncbi:MAG: NAD-dependent epimerase/dehydratase family protein, partial [Leptospiraceae bacterium]|nr:NAD-dependent epimerase/dehydratase family protein [Leptospiraceae bacterium]